MEEFGIGSMNGKQREEMCDQDLDKGTINLDVITVITIIPFVAVYVVLLKFEGILTSDLPNQISQLLEISLIQWVLVLLIAPVISYALIIIELGKKGVKKIKEKEAKKEAKDKDKDKKKEDDDKNKDLDRAWGYYEHADDLLHNRINLFLVAQSMLIISFATLICNQTTFINIILILIILIGAIYSLIWYYVCLKLVRRLNFLNECILKDDYIYKMYLKWVKKGKGLFSLDPLAELIPMCTIGFWFILLVLTWWYRFDPTSLYYPILIIILLISLTGIHIRRKIPAKITEEN
ncbi:MAG: hypothetical protein KAT65_26620 [Methanophagales archaeon]|nr:hypothetical protein [Methanophagales archaeon]